MRLSSALAGLALFSAAASVFGTAQEEAAAQQVSLVWWNHMEEGGPQNVLFKEYLSEFEAENPNIRVQMDNSQHEIYMNQRLPTAIATGDAPDLFAMTYRQLFTYHENGSMAPIDGAALEQFGVSSIDGLKQQWAGGVLEAYQIGDNYYGIPWQFNIYSYSINTEHFRDAGLDPEGAAPRYWEDVYEVGQKLVQKDSSGRITREALSFPFALSAAWYLLELEPIVRARGGSILNADQSESLITSDAVVGAMEEIERRFDDGLADKDLASASDFHSSTIPTGNISMAVTGQWGPPRWTRQYDVAPGTFHAIPYPTYQGADPPISTTSWAWVVSSTSEHKAEAWKLADFLTSFPSRNLLETGDTIPRAGWSETEGAKTIPQSALWEELLGYSMPLANYQKYADVSEPLKRAMQEILLSDGDIRDTLARAKEEIDRSLAE